MPPSDFEPPGDRSQREALGHPDRLTLLRLLVDFGPATCEEALDVAAVAEPFSPMSLRTLTYHAKILESCGLLRRVPAGGAAEAGPVLTPAPTAPAVLASLLSHGPSDPGH